MDQKIERRIREVIELWDESRILRSWCWRHDKEAALRERLEKLDDYNEKIGKLVSELRILMIDE